MKFLHTAKELIEKEFLAINSTSERRGIMKV